MVDASCNLENIPKHCLKQIGTESSHKYYNTAAGAPFRTAGCFFSSFVEQSGEIIYELEQRLSVQLKSRCWLRREQLMLSVWIDFRLDMRRV